uniref:Uncharacterized protein n=1 Tax=Neogobius melanostomus TaxID=47308 RepID=A0A8C6S561_9GOBI
SIKTRVSVCVSHLLNCCTCQLLITALCEVTSLFAAIFIFIILRFPACCDPPPPVLINLSNLRLICLNRLSRANRAACMNAYFYCFLIVTGCTHIAPVYVFLNIRQMHTNKV